MTWDVFWNVVIGVGLGTFMHEVRKWLKRTALALETSNEMYTGNVSIAAEQNRLMRESQALQAQSLKASEDYVAEQRAHMAKCEARYLQRIGQQPDGPVTH